MADGHGTGKSAAPGHARLFERLRGGGADRHRHYQPVPGEVEREVHDGEMVPRRGGGGGGDEQLVRPDRERRQLRDGKEYRDRPRPSGGPGQWENGGAGSVFLPSSSTTAAPTTPMENGWQETFERVMQVSGGRSCDSRWPPPVSDTRHHDLDRVSRQGVDDRRQLPPASRSPMDDGNGGRLGWHHWTPDELVTACATPADSIIAGSATYRHDFPQPRHEQHAWSDSQAHYQPELGTTSSHTSPPYASYPSAHFPTPQQSFGLPYEVFDTGRGGSGARLRGDTTDRWSATGYALDLSLPPGAEAATGTRSGQGPYVLGDTTPYTREVPRDAARQGEPLSRMIMPDPLDYHPGPVAAPSHGRTKEGPASWSGSADDGQLGVTGSGSRSEGVSWRQEHVTPRMKPPPPPPPPTLAAMPKPSILLPGPSRNLVAGQRPPTTDTYPRPTSAPITAPAPRPRSHLRPLRLPSRLLPTFLQIASDNTRRGIETCALLLGARTLRPARSREGVGGAAVEELVVECLLVPRQIGRRDTCQMEDEVQVISVQEKRGFIALGWIHTHPTQSCFMSSMDLHTHAAYQQTLPEAIAIVCAPRSKPSYGIFRLTEPGGLRAIQRCHHTGLFHEHPSVNGGIYTDADYGHVKVRDMPLEVIDLRRRGGGS